MYYYESVLVLLRTGTCIQDWHFDNLVPLTDGVSESQNIVGDEEDGDIRAGKAPSLKKKRKRRRSKPQMLIDEQKEWEDKTCNDLLSMVHRGKKAHIRFAKAMKEFKSAKRGNYNEKDGTLRILKLREVEMMIVDDTLEKNEEGKIS